MNILLFSFVMGITIVIGRIIIDNINEKAHKESIYNEILHEELVYHKKIKFDIINLPQLSFERWLTFYNSSAENWEFNNEKIPIYVKDKKIIPIFWKTPEDLDQFQDWLDTEYKGGNAAVFQNKRDKALAELTKSLQEDIKARQEETNKNFDMLEQQVKNAMPQKEEEEDPIQKCLRKEHEQNVKCYRLSDFIAYLCKQYPDYTYAESNQLVTNNGTIVAEIKLMHKYKLGNFIQIIGEYNINDKTWSEKTSMR